MFRLSQQEREYAVALETHDHELRTLRNKTEASLEFLKQEHTMAASKVSCYDITFESLNILIHNV